MNCRREYSHFPFFINLADKKIVVIGGGKIALRRVQVLVKFGAKVIVIAPEIKKELDLMNQKGKIHVIKKEYKEGDIKGADMVIAATDKKDVNEAVVKDARKLKIFVNTVDCKENCDFFFPAIFSDENIIGGIISNNGENHRQVKEKASKIREFLKRGVLQNENNKGG